MLERLITGPMYAGKTRRLWQLGVQKSDINWDYFRLSTQCQENKKENLESHDGVSVEGYRASRLSLIEAKFKVILVDEIQFAKPEEVEQFLEKHKDRTIYMAGLDYDFLGQKFETTEFCRSLAKETETLTAKCAYCGLKAAHKTIKISGDPMQRLDEEARYRAICQLCWRELAWDGVLQNGYLYNIDEEKEKAHVAQLENS